MTKLAVEEPVNEAAMQYVKHFVYYLYWLDMLMVTVNVCSLDSGENQCS